MLQHAERLRHEVAGRTLRAHKSAMGQFMTSAPVAEFMAGMFEPRPGPFRLLDPGAGLGALTCAVLERWKAGALGQGSMAVVAHELDDRLREHLLETLEAYRPQGVEATVHGGDYLAAAADAIEGGGRGFTHCIMNPPYKKIGMESQPRSQARRVGLETVNYYSAFVGVALEQMAPGGQLVAIIPRSFANGPYYRPFRRFMLDRAALRRIHLFDSRTQAFRDDEVLQENVILVLERGGAQGQVLITTSTDDTFSDLREQSFDFASVVKPADPECFIHVPGAETDVLEASPMVSATLADLGVGVATGPVVDFRMREHLRAMPCKDTVPLLYPQHFNGPRTVWPVEGSKKPNAIVRNKDTQKWLFPGGTYVAVRRFSSKEERRRVVASLVRSQDLGKPEHIGFENHLNVFHTNKQGLDEDLAWGLFVYLNSTALDEHLRRFSGHTQVNATDLKNIRYPSRRSLEWLGEQARLSTQLDQERIDTLMGEVLG